MSNDRGQWGEESTPGPVAGERLAEARRLKQISLPDVARQLHLDEPRVQALEENRFDALGAPVFAKGYLRKYAKLVGVSADDVMADYYTLNRATGAPPVVGPPRRQPREFDLAPWIVAILVIIALAVAAYWWLQRTPMALPDPTTGTPVTQPAEDRDSGQAAETREPEPAPGGQPEASSTGAELETSVPPAPAVPPDTELPAPPAASAGVELTLEFSGDCWTEITDADGRRLYFDLGTAGERVTVAGRPPLDVLVGDGNNVQLTVDGRPYEVAASDRRGNTASFTIR